MRNYAYACSPLPADSNKQSNPNACKKDIQTEETMINRTEHSIDTQKTTSKKTYKKHINTVISLLLSVININSAASLEIWTKSGSRTALLVFFLAGSAICFMLTLNLLKQSEARLKLHSVLWGIPMAAAYVLGCRMRRDGTALSSLSHLPVLVIQTACLSVFAGACIAPFLQGFPGLRAKGKLHPGNSARFLPGDISVPKKTKPGRPMWQIWLFSATIILICWIPVFLAYYPSVFAYDAEGQLYQVLAHDYSTHHPLLHTIFLGAFFQLGGNMLGSYSAGMAVHSAVQMLLMACTFGYTLAFLYQKGAPVPLRIILLLFYAVFPTNSILALSTTKDVLFSALVLLHTLCICQMAERTDLTSRNWFLYILWTALMLLFRNNALYALLLSIPPICLMLRGRAEHGRRLWRRYLICSVLALVLFAAGSMTLKVSLKAHSGSPREMLSIPLQQMARTRVKAEATLSPAIRQELDQYLPEEWIFAAYDPYLADPVKNRAVIHDNPAGLVKTWIRLGTEHPQIYIDAFLDNSVGYWFLEDRTHAQIYGLGAESGFGYLSTDNRTMPAGCEIVEHSYLPGLRALMERIISDNAYQNIPVLRILFAPAFYWWLLCLYMAAAVYRKQYLLLLPAVFLVSYYLTLLLSPAVLIRYMYPFVVTVPVLCCYLLCTRRGTVSACSTHRSASGI